MAKKKVNLAKSVRRAKARRLESKKATGIERTLDQFQFHLPDLMRDKLAEAATANGRSLNGEIIHRLTQSLERDETKKLSDYLKTQGDRLAKVEEEIAALVEQLRARCRRRDNDHLGDSQCQAPHSCSPNITLILPRALYLAR
jgi:hypothetical protein